MKEIATRSVKESSAEHHYATLARLLQAVSDDHSQLRQLVYEFARHALRRNLHRRFEDGDWAGIETELTELKALETAIDHIESEYEHRSLTFDPQPPLTYQAVLDGEQRDATLSGNDEGAHWVSRSGLQTAADAEVSVTSSRSMPSHFGGPWQAQLIIATMVAIAVCAAVDGAFTHVFLGAKGAAVHSGTNVRTGGTENPPKAETSSIVKIRQQSEPSIPIPRNYGVFAITGGQLAELEPLQMRIPD
jgi:hypothetical protein